MSRFDTPNDTWYGVIQEFEQKLCFHDQDPICTEELWRDTLTDICDERKERDAQRLLNRTRRQHGRIIEIATALDQVNQFHPPHCLRSLVWHLLARAIQGAFDENKHIAEFLQITEELNDQVPALNRERLFQYAYEPAVQKPLQELFRDYMNCYLAMFSDFATFPTVLSLDDFERHLNQVKQFFQPRTAEWEAALKVAEAEEQRRLLSATSPSLPNASSHEPTPALGTNAHFRFYKSLGHGTYGNVSMVQEPTSKVYYAQKFIRIRDRHDARTKGLVEAQVKSEVDIMQKLRHHHIASVLFYVRDLQGFSLIMLPVGDYDLRHFLEDRCVKPDFPKEEIKYIDNWFGCLISALAYAHDQRIKHEDIKPSNILIKDHRPYLADFGSAKDFSNLETSTSPDFWVAGTPVYWPPENKEERGRPADIFALGCVFSEMITVRQGCPLSDYQKARYVSDTDFGYSFRENLEGVESWLRNLPGMERRNSTEAFLLDVILNMLDPRPDERFTAKEIKKKLRQDEDVLFCSSC